MKTYFLKRFPTKFLLTPIFLCLLTIPVHSQAYKVRMAMVGNSITYGATLSNPATESYPAQLSQMLSTVYGDTVDIQNYGVSGRTMMRSAENPIWIENAFKNALLSVPDICLIMLGTNDSKPYRWASWGDEFLDDYLTMIDTFQFRNPDTKFIVCYPPPIWPQHEYGTTFDDKHNDSILVTDIVPLIDTVVKRTGAVLIDFHTPFKDSVLLFPDYLHPNVEGSRQMAKILFDTIQKINLIYQVDAGRAYISNFKQITSPAPHGREVELSWTTIFADSVFLDDEPVDSIGSKVVIADSQKVYTLIAKNTKNTSTFLLSLKTYLPVKSGISITTASYDYANGYPVYLYSKYFDQYNKNTFENTSGITWTITAGDALLSDQTDTSILFTPVVKGSVTVQASDGQVSGQKVLSVNKDPVSVETINTNSINVFPIPAANKLFFQLEKTNFNEVQIVVYNLIGKELLNKNCKITGQDNSVIELDLSGISPGSYIYAVYEGSKVTYGKFLKQGAR